MYEEVHDDGATPSLRAILEVEPLSTFCAFGMIFRSLGDILVIDKTVF